MPDIRVDYEIEDNVPIPVTVASKSMPLDDLQVGQSIQFPIERRSYVQIKASRLKNRTGKTFTVKKIDDKHGRVWRKS